MSLLHEEISGKEVGLVNNGEKFNILEEAKFSHDLCKDNYSVIGGEEKKSASIEYNGERNREKSTVSRPMIDEAKNMNLFAGKKGKRRSVSFATTARMRCDSHSGEIELNESFNQENNKDFAAIKRDNTLDMQMSVGLSIICKDNELSMLSSSNKISKICHSTPLRKTQKDEVVPAENNVLILNEVSSTADQNEVPIIPKVNVLKETNINQTNLSLNRSENERENSFENRSRASKRKSFSDVEPVHNDKIIQVSRTIFGSSTEGTSYTLSKKKSGDFSTSYSYQEGAHIKVINKSKSSLESSQKRRLKVRDADISVESRSYHSDFQSTLEDETPLRKVPKKVVFKDSSYLDNTTTDHRSSTSGSGYYVSKNRKSVAFRELISLIDRSSEVVESGAEEKNSTTDISTRARSFFIHKTDMSVLEKDSKSSDIEFLEGNQSSLLDAAQVADVILSVNDEESNEISKECSLYSKVVQTVSDNRVKRNRKKNSYNSFEEKNCKRKSQRNPHILSEYNENSVQAINSWISPKLLKFLNEKLLNDDMDQVLKSERIITILCSVVNGVKNLCDLRDIESTVLPLKFVLFNYGICTNMIEYFSFIMRFTHFEFQRKVLPLGSYFGSVNSVCRKSLKDSIFSDEEILIFDKFKPDLYATN